MLCVREAKSRDDKEWKDKKLNKNNDNKNASNASNTIKLNTINPDIDESVLREHFKKAGVIKRVIKWENKDFAFIGFENPKDAAKALAMDMSLLGDNVKPEMDDKKNNQVDKRNVKGGNYRGGIDKGNDRY
mmetsp:Transcript_30334/g.25599  ORF Transcript_30334/g.25599 Transcript_30334/m.25599 type:complete len:131 (-) Transcript_30334:99-491(-)